MPVNPTVLILELNLVKISKNLKMQLKVNQSLFLLSRENMENKLEFDVKIALIWNKGPKKFSLMPKV